MDDGELTKESIKDLPINERKALTNLIHRDMSRLKDAEYDEYYEKHAELLDDLSNEAIWEENHVRIIACINNCISKNGIMPSKSLIARLTGLQRKSVAKHLESFSGDANAAERTGRFKFTQDALMASLYKKAVGGDVSAIKFLYELMGLHGKKPASLPAIPAQPNSVTIHNQHNYIQINGIKLSQEEVQQLQPEQLKQIESILVKALPVGMKS
jgi:hypothetical protein